MRPFHLAFTVLAAAGGTLAGVYYWRAKSGTLDETKRRVPSAYSATLRDRVGAVTVAKLR